MSVSYGPVTATVLRQATGRHGDPTGPPEQIDLPDPCVLYPVASSEITDSRDQATIDAGLIAPTGADVRVTDRIRINGDPQQVYEVIGEPADVTSPSTGWAPGVVVHLSRWEG